MKQIFLSLIIFYLGFVSSKGIINGFMINDFKAIWETDSTQIRFNISAKTKGWLGIGFNAKHNQMKGSDIIVGWVNDDGNVTVIDSYATEYNMPPSDIKLGGTEDVHEVTGRRIGEYTEISFYRNLISYDKFDVNITRGMKIFMLYAYGDDKSVDFEKQIYKKHKDYGTLKVDFGSAGPLKKSRFGIILHSFLMVLSWAVLSTIGGFIARYLKKESDNWFFYHILLQSITVILTTISIFIIVAIRNFRADTHQVLGILILIFTLLQPIIGVISHFQYQPTRTSPPLWPDKIHWWIGRFTTFFSLLNIVFGIHIYTENVNKKYFVLMLVPFIIWFFSCFVLLVYLEMSKKKKVLSDDPLTVKFIELKDPNEQINPNPKILLTTRAVFIILGLLSFALMFVFLLTSIIVPY